MTRVTTGRVADLAVAGVLAGWVTVTALSQHPARSFDRFRRFDPTGVMLPNWRFFAPEPAVHDFRVLHRVRTEVGDVSGWQESTTLAERRARQSVWFPDRRRDKAVTDLSNELITLLGKNVPDITRSVSYRLLRDHVASVIAAQGDRPAGFQFLLARAGGYDETLEPEYLFASPYEPWSDR